MSQDLITYSAQKIKIKALRGNRFELTITVKNSAGGDYDFSNDSVNASTYDNAYFQVVSTGGTNVLNSYTSAIESNTGETIDFEATISEDGKIVITSTNDNGFWPQVGTYKYNLFTEKVGDNGNTSPSELTHWLYGDFIVMDNNPAFSTQGGVPSDFLG